MTDILLYIPCYNGAAFLPRVLDGLSRLRRPAPTRMILVDDGSTDDSAAIVRAAGLEVISQPRNLGLGAGRNRALQLADGPFIASLDADVVPDENWLVTLHTQLTREPALGGLGGRLVETVLTGAANNYRARHAAQNWGEQPLRNPAHIFGANNLFRVDVLRAAGGYNERYRTNFEDVDMCHRLRARGVELAYNPDARAYHLREDDVESLARMQAGWFQLRPSDAAWPRRAVRTVRLASRLGRYAIQDVKDGAWDAALLGPKLFARHVRNLARG